MLDAKLLRYFAFLWENGWAKLWRVKGGSRRVGAGKYCAKFHVQPTPFDAYRLLQMSVFDVNCVLRENKVVAAHSSIPKTSRNMKMQFHAQLRIERKTFNRVVAGRGGAVDRILRANRVTATQVGIPKRSQNMKTDHHARFHVERNTFKKSWRVVAGPVDHILRANGVTAAQGGILKVS